MKCFIEQAAADSQMWAFEKRDCDVETQKKRWRSGESVESKLFCAWLYRSYNLHPAVPKRTILLLPVLLIDSFCEKKRQKNKKERYRSFSIHVLSCPKSMKITSCCHVCTPIVVMLTSVKAQHVLGLKHPSLWTPSKLDDLQNNMSLKRKNAFW